MGTKAEPGRFDGYGKAEDNEPIFCLIGRDPAALLAATAKADAGTAARAKDASARVALTFKSDPVSTRYALKGYAFRQSPSDVSASSWIQYDPGKPVTMEIPNWNRLLPGISIAPPAA